MLCLDCDLSQILEQARPPDAELVDLIEQAFLEGQIDGPEGRSGLLVVEGETTPIWRELLPTVLPKAQRAKP